MPKENYLQKVITADDKEIGALRHPLCEGRIERRAHTDLRPPTTI
jgi:hypothetical protein